MVNRVQDKNGNGSVQKLELSVRTLELCDFLVDGMTLSANADDFEDWAARIATARKEIQKMLRDAGEQPILHTPEGPIGGLYAGKG